MRTYVRTCVRTYVSVTLQECQLGLERTCHALGISIRTLAHACAYIVRMDNPCAFVTSPTKMRAEGDVEVRESAVPSEQG